MSLFFFLQMDAHAYCDWSISDSQVVVTVNGCQKMDQTFTFICLELPYPFVTNGVLSAELNEGSDLRAHLGFLHGFEGRITQVPLRSSLEQLTPLLLVVELMVVCFPSTPKKLAATIACFLSGAAIFAVGMHLSYVNVAPQQARIKARNDFVKETLKKKYGYIPPMQARSMARNHLVKETFSDPGFKK
ncbi:hypothetical protein RJT34_14956 [Clitoria ternatea]|uniref:Uncharacterized protein n=1 Tax=Clitoria ternatea TaxID=43366 RepID=A0AAN9JR70_CLITE